GERRELAQRVLRVLEGVLPVVLPDGGQDDPLQAQLAVLDLGDVLELGRQPLDAPEGCPLLALELVAVDAEAVLRAPLVLAQLDLAVRERLGTTVEHALAGVA